MNVNITVGPGTFQRQPTDENGILLNDANGAPILLDIPYSDKEILLQDGTNTYIIVKKRFDAAYAFSTKQMIILYQDGNVLVDYAYGTDIFNITSVSGEDLVTKLKAL